MKRNREGFFFCEKKKKLETMHKNMKRLKIKWWGKFHFLVLYFHFFKYSNKNI